MSIEVTQDQVDNAKLLLALDRADGRRSDEWIVRLANAKQPMPQPTVHQAAPSARTTSRPATRT